MFATVRSYDADGIAVSESLPSRDYRVAWRDVHRFHRTDKGLSCWYAKHDSHLATARVPRRLALDDARDAWREALTRELEERGALEGFCALSPGELAPAGPIRKFAATLSGVVLGVLALALMGRLAVHIAAVLQTDNLEIRRAVLSGLWTLAPVILAAGTGLLLAVRDRLLVRRFRSWRITRDGLLRRESHGGWTSVALADRQGRPNPRIPVGCFSKPVLAVLLLRLLQERQGIAPAGPATLFGGSPLRLGLLWPAVLFAVLTLIPRGLGLLAPFSSDLPRALGLYYALGIGGAAPLALAELALAPARRRRHAQTAAAAASLRKRLGW